MVDEINYFEDVMVGDTLTFGPLSISREEIIAFAAQYDAQPFHLSDEAAAETHFGSLSASGWHTTALFMKMFVAEMQDSGHQDASLGAMGVDELRWLMPVRPGDTLSGTSEVIEKKASRTRPEMGIVKSRVTIINQQDQPVMTLMPIVLLRTRPA
jgi:acyl dehydratase